MNDKNDKNDEKILKADIEGHFIGEINKDNRHPDETIYQYEEGEGNAEATGQRDPADTGDHGIGGSNGGSEMVDDSNIEENEEDLERNL